ncbi:hypothetical protein KM043_017829 [Ampulex compressa]|nr:hypothetical protein KM043_017829 [Ampulex compressa]
MLNAGRRLVDTVVKILGECQSRRWTSGARFSLFFEALSDCTERSSTDERSSRSARLLDYTSINANATLTIICQIYLRWALHLDDQNNKRGKVSLPKARLSLTTNTSNCKVIPRGRTAGILGRRSHEFERIEGEDEGSGTETEERASIEIGPAYDRARKTHWAGRIARRTIETDKNPKSILFL